MAGRTLSWIVMLLFTGCASVPLSNHRMLIEVPDGAIYPGGWGKDDMTVYATVHRADRWRIAKIQVKSGESSWVDVGLPGAGVGDVRDGLLAIESVAENGSDIYVFDLESGQLEPITSTEGYEWHPVFSPDGSALFFDVQTANGPDIYRYTRSTGELSRIAGHPQAEQAARVSPEGNRVAFYRRQRGERDNHDIVVLDLTSGWEYMVARTEHDEGYAHWHPDGDHIVFTSNRLGKYDLFIGCVSTSSAVVRIDATGNNRYPKWALSGDRILYQSDRSGHKALYIARPPALPTCD